MKSVSFDVVQIYSNHCRHAPYTLKPIDNVEHTVAYAVKVGDNYFLLGENGDGVYLSDVEEN